MAKLRFFYIKFWHLINIHLYHINTCFVLLFKGFAQSSWTLTDKNLANHINTSRSTVVSFGKKTQQITSSNSTISMLRPNVENQINDNVVHGFFSYTCTQTIRIIDEKMLYTNKMFKLICLPNKTIIQHWNKNVTYFV